jgi:hypothetical protein
VHFFPVPAESQVNNVTGEPDALPSAISTPNPLAAQFKFALGLLIKADCPRYSYYANRNARPQIRPFENTVNEKINDKYQ